jgi:hypothetical protein
MASRIPTLNEAISAGEKAAAVDTAMISKMTDMAGDFAVNLSIALIILVATVFPDGLGVTRRMLSRVRASPRPTVVSFAVQVVQVVVYIIHRRLQDWASDHLDHRRARSRFPGGRSGAAGHAVHHRGRRPLLVRPQGRRRHRSAGLQARCSGLICS